MSTAQLHPYILVITDLQKQCLFIINRWQKENFQVMLTMADNSILEFHYILMSTLDVLGIGQDMHYDCLLAFESGFNPAAIILLPGKGHLLLTVTVINSHN